MVRLVSPILIAVLSILALSGCIDEPAPAKDDPDVGVVTDPGDFSYLANASAAGAHVHDYWNGQDIRRVVDGTQGCRGTCIVYGDEDGAPMGDFRPATDHIVPQGTARLHVVAAWDIAAGDYGDIALYVKTAQEVEQRFVTLLENGVPVTFNSTNDDNDPPHHRLSLWEFTVSALPKDGSDEASIQDFEVYLEIDAERGLPIPAFPPHPDLWNGATELVLHQQERKVDHQIETPLVWYCAGCLGTHRPDNGSIVPYDAARVEVSVEVTEGMPNTIGLLFHGADTWNYAKAEPVEDKDGRRVWYLDITDRPDSPYAKQSLWSFRLYNQQPVEYPKVWTGTYEIVIKAVK